MLCPSLEWLDPSPPHCQRPANVALPTLAKCSNSRSVWLGMQRSATQVRDGLHRRRPRAVQTLNPAFLSGFIDALNGGLGPAVPEDDEDAPELVHEHVEVW